jgi:hypothetical protein
MVTPTETETENGEMGLCPKVHLKTVVEPSPVPHVSLAATPVELKVV